MTQFEFFSLQPPRSLRLGVLRVSIGADWTHSTKSIIERSVRTEDTQRTGDTEDAEATQRITAILLENLT